MVAAAASLAIVVLALAMGGCGGGYGSSTQPNRGYRFNHGDRPIRKYLPHHDDQCHGAVVWKSVDD